MASDVPQILVHTGQHYDANMSDVFFQQLGLPAPEFNLQVGSGSHAQQTAAIMTAFERILNEKRPSLVVVYGDVNSTVAAALVCAKLGTRVAHVEAGLRSFDRTMPEEINRLLTDQMSDLLFTPSEDADRNLRREGIPRERIHLVGNVMIDALVRLLPQARLPEIDLPSRYVLATLHRPSNVDDAAGFEKLLAVLIEISEHTPVLFPVHPRTAKALKEHAPDRQGSRLYWLDPQPYLQFLSLQQRAELVITDSGGIQEETTFLGIPCLTVRDNTERPITVTCGTNIVVGRDASGLGEHAMRILGGEKKQGTVPPLWDGHAAERIARVIANAEAAAF